MYFSVICVLLTRIFQMHLSHLKDTSEKQGVTNPPSLVDQRIRCTYRISILLQTAHKEQEAQASQNGAWHARNIPGCVCHLDRCFFLNQYFAHFEAERVEIVQPLLGFLGVICHLVNFLHQFCCRSISSRIVSPNNFKLIPQSAA